MEYNNTILLTGNGFSMNFDSGFSDIMDRIYEAHKELLRNSKFKVYSNKKEYRDEASINYNNVKDYLRRVNKDELYNILEEGFKFGARVLNDESLIQRIEENRYTTDLVFGANELSILKDLIYQWKTKGLKGINIEYIPILAYMYVVIDDREIKEYDMEFNKFIKLLRLGDSTNLKSSIKNIGLKENIMRFMTLNGFITYYRMLFSVAIFNNGKAIDIKELDNINNLNLETIIKYLNSFKTVMTLNYDKILEGLLGKDIKHIHGEFLENSSDCYNYQSLSFNHNGKNINFSNILIGDYIYNKTARAIINNLSSKFLKNNQFKTGIKIIENEIKETNANNIMMFGLNINNDQHILRAIICGFKFANISNPTITYSYFLEEDKISFENIFRSILTFSDELNNYAKTINIKYVDAKEILDSVFFNKIASIPS